MEELPRRELVGLLRVAIRRISLWEGMVVEGQKATVILDLYQTLSGSRTTSIHHEDGKRSH